MGCRVTLVCADRAKEYQAGRFLDYCRQNCIKIRLSASHRHETNGLAERANLTHANLTRALLVHAQRPLAMWELAMETASYLINRQPTSGNPHF